MAESDDAILANLAAGVPLDTLLLQIVRWVEAAHPHVLASIMVVDETGTHLRHGAAPSLSQIFNEAVDGLEIGPGIGCCGQAAFSRKLIVVEDLFTHPNWAPFRQLARVAGIQSSASQPILADDAKRVLGTVAIYHKEAGLPSEAELASLKHAAGLARSALEARIPRPSEY